MMPGMGVLGRLRVQLGKLETRSYRAKLLLRITEIPGQRWPVVCALRVKLTEREKLLLREEPSKHAFFLVTGYLSC